MTGGEDIDFSGLEIDLILEDGMERELGSWLTCWVIATPGHTRDFLSFSLPELEAMIMGEAVGVFDRNFKIHHEFTSCYRNYLFSFYILSFLSIEILMMSYFFTLTGVNAREYVHKSLVATREFKARIERYLTDCHGNCQEVAERIFQEVFTATGAILQDARPYRTNLEAKIRAIAEGR